MGKASQEVSMSVFDNKDIKAKVLDEKSSRKVLAHDEDAMICHLYFEKGGIGTPHKHVHTQICYILSGVFDFTLDGKTERISAGDSVYIPSDVIHGLECIEKGELLDVFTPERKDFLS